MASGVPVVATGRGGPLELVENSRTGWLYEPGDLSGMRARVLDLMGDDAKRRAFGAAAQASVQDRTWPALCSELVGHYHSVISGEPVSALGPRPPGSLAVEPPRRGPQPELARAGSRGGPARLGRGWGE